MQSLRSEISPPLDALQLRRIEATHRGFLYQHLYASACLLLAQQSGATSIIVEKDEDVEIVLPDQHLYVQVKTRSAPLTFTDIQGALERFDSLRIQHQTGIRSGRAIFVVTANIQPSTTLQRRIKEENWPTDVRLHFPNCPDEVDAALPAPWHNVSEALQSCVKLAAGLPYGLLAPETLIWKLAGCVMLAATGNAPRTDHSFSTDELPDIFEQLVVQLHDFPAPPTTYRPQTDEPPLLKSDRVRIITGYSGAGKTSWVSQAITHSTNKVVYFDASDTPGPALASSLARELAAHLYGKSGGGLGKVLLPGASGLELLHAIGTRLVANKEKIAVVLDNAHHMPSADINAVIQKANLINFILICQPCLNVHELESILSVTSEPLRGWSTDTIAIEAASRGCRGDLAANQRLLDLTAGMPLYVQNALAITAKEYNGAIVDFCADLEMRTHTVETAQEIILARVFCGYSEASRRAIATLSLLDTPLDQYEASSLLIQTLTIDDKGASALIRQLRSTGAIDFFGGNRLKVHDAIRMLGRAHLETLGKDAVHNAQVALKSLLLVSIQKQWELPKLMMYLRLLAATGDVKTLVQLVTDELFHELGVSPEIMAFLEKAAASEETEPEERFWALDGLVFADMKQGKYQKASEQQEAMARIIEEHNLGGEERLALAMKRMNILALDGKVDEVIAIISEISGLLPDKPAHQRIFKYNAANALFHLGKHEAAIIEASDLIQEYYDLLGVAPEDIVGKNPDKIRPLLKQGKDVTDDIKHLADCLDLYAQAMNASGQDACLARIHAMKFYDLACTPDSLIRVGQCLVDEFVGRNDFIGAREIIETNLLPNVQRLKLLERIIPVRSQYAVILAYCGEIDAADAEMARLEAYESGLDEKGQWELRNQRKLISEIRQKGPPRQWVPIDPEIASGRRKIGRNELCPCGSGKKYKKCHGAV